MPLASSLYVPDPSPFASQSNFAVIHSFFKQILACLLYLIPCYFVLQEKGHTEVVLKAMGRAINKTVTIAEILKRRISGLHQITEIESTDIIDVWEPLEEGLEPCVSFCVCRIPNWAPQLSALPRLSKLSPYLFICISNMFLHSSTRSKETTRHVSSIKIRLSKVALETGHYGYEFASQSYSVSFHFNFPSFRRPPSRCKSTASPWPPMSLQYH